MEFEYRQSPSAVSSALYETGSSFERSAWLSISPVLYVPLSLMAPKRVVS